MRLDGGAAASRLLPAQRHIFISHSGLQSAARRCASAWQLFLLNKIEIGSFNLIHSFNLVQNQFDHM